MPRPSPQSRRHLKMNIVLNCPRPLPIQSLTRPIDVVLGSGGLGSFLSRNPLLSSTKTKTNLQLFFPWIPRINADTGQALKILAQHYGLTPAVPILNSIALRKRAPQKPMPSLNPLRALPAPGWLLTLLVMIRINLFAQDVGP